MGPILCSLTQQWGGRERETRALFLITCGQDFRCITKKDRVALALLHKGNAGLVAVFMAGELGTGQEPFLSPAAGRASDSGSASIYPEHRRWRTLETPGIVFSSGHHCRKPGPFAICKLALANPLREIRACSGVKLVYCLCQSRSFTLVNSANTRSNLKADTQFM